MANGDGETTNPLDFGDPGDPGGEGALDTESLKQALETLAIKQIAQAYADVDRQLVQLASGQMTDSQGNPLRQGTRVQIPTGKDDDGNDTFEFVDEYNIALDNINSSLNVLGTSLNARGFDVAGEPLPDGLDNPQVAIAQGNLGARLAELGETQRANRVHEGLLAEQETRKREEFEQSKLEFEQLRDDQVAQEAARLEETQRGTNIEASVGLLAQQIRRGELSSREAANRMAAAAENADLQLRTAESFAGQNLRPGAQHFPNLGPDGAVAGIAKHFGLPFEGFATGGTFGLNPAATGAGIQQAQQNNALAGVDAAIARTAQSLSGLGVPGVA